MPRLRRQIILLLIASVTPLSYFVFPFVCGFFNLSQGYLMLLVPLDFVGLAITGIAVAALPTALNTGSRVALGVVAWIVTVALFFAFPAGAKTWTLGFATNLKLTKNPKQLQQWAVAFWNDTRQGI